MWMAQRSDFVDAHWTAPEPLLESLALEALHDEEIDSVLVTNVVERADMRMIEAGDRLRFALEPRPLGGIRRAPRREHLDGDGPIQPSIDGAIHVAHAATAEQIADFVPAQGSAGRNGHVAVAHIIGPR